MNLKLGKVVRDKDLEVAGKFERIIRERCSTCREQKWNRTVWENLIQLIILWLPSFPPPPQPQYSAYLCSYGCIIPVVFT